MRRGNFDHMIKDKIEMADGPDYIGLQIANSGLSFLILWFAFGFLITPFCLPIMWEAIIQNRNVIISILTLPIIQFACTFVGKKLIVSVDAIKHRRIWAIYELMMLYIAIGASVTMCIARIFVGFFVGIIGLVRMDKPILPDWLLEIVYADKPNMAYLGQCVIYHAHNHPITITFARVLGKHLETTNHMRTVDGPKAPQAYTNRTKLARKFHLYYVLHTYPKLREERVREQKFKEFEEF